MKILVTGGAGYIGSHIVWQLIDAGHDPVVFDNLYAGHRGAVGPATFVEGDLADVDALHRLLGQHRFDGVIHCAAHIWVGESVADPLKYYMNNSANAFRLFDACARHGLQMLVFSSTAAVYGQAAGEFLDEGQPLDPINPYGRSKLMAERALRDAAEAHGMRYAILRYFNVAGADAQLRTGEATPDNSHLIKVACEAAMGLRPGMSINGTDYPTPDGTCIRDYVHVSDLAAVHLRAFDHLAGGGASFIANCGYGHGYSVREVLHTVRRVSGVDFPIVEGPRRPGDPAQLVAKVDKLHGILDWRPRLDDLDEIVASAWRWECKLASTRKAPV